MTQTTSLITLTNPRSAGSEAYRTLRTNLMFSSIDEPVHTIVITSPAPEAGKSTVVANLAVTLAQGGKSTILVDCDLRRPSQHELWGIGQTPGLSDLILDGGEPPLQDVGIENLSVLTSGTLPPNPADLLGSSRFDEVIEILRGKVDYVLFDAPPVIAVTDAALLAVKVEGTVLVMKAGTTKRDHGEQAKDLLERIKARLLGVVLTDAHVDTQVGGYYGV